MDEMQATQNNKEERSDGVKTPLLSLAPKHEGSIEQAVSVNPAEVVQDQKISPNHSPSSFPQPETASATDSGDGDVREADVFVNNEYSFRVDQVTAEGIVRIRFRSDANLDFKPFSPQKILAFLQNKKTAPEGDWFFGSREEFQQFADENGYHLERRGRAEK